MTDLYTYSKNRQDVGKHPNFTDSKNVLKIGIIPDEEDDRIKHVNSEQIHAKKNPNCVTLSNFP